MVAIAAERSFMSETARYRETLRRLAIIDEAFVGNQAALGLGPAGTLALDAKVISLLQLAVSAAIGAPGVCLEWSTARAVCAAPDVAIALGYDIGAALEEPDDQ